MEAVAVAVTAAAALPQLASRSTGMVWYSTGNGNMGACMTLSVYRYGM